MSKTFYEVLDVSADASEAAIRDAYREKVKEYHPDVCDRPDATELFKRVKRAEEVLCDPEERAAYDRLGHETYVGDGTGATTDSSSSGSDVTTVADVREAAARTAGRDHDAGGRSASWRERERRASQRRAADWFGGRGGARTGSSASEDADGGHSTGDEDDWFDAGFDYENPGTRWTYSPPDEEEAESEGTADADAHAGGADATASTTATGASDPTSRAGPTPGTGSSAGTGAAARPSGTGSRRSRGNAATSGSESRHAATEAWGHNETREHTHAVHEWASTGQGTRVPRPNWTQDDVVALAATMFLYPIFLLLTAIPAFHVSVNVVAGVATLAYVAGLLPKPSMSLPVFGTWSVGMPALLLAFDVPIASLAFVVAVGGVWIPFLFAVAVASVLIR